jgi:RNA 2',3'-cyclic 3'-phosphodiesterase
VRLVRLFLALEPPAQVIAHLDGALGAARAAHPELRWVDSRRWHLTLAFFGEVPDGRVDRLQQRLDRKIAGSPAMALRFAGAGRFDGRVLWVGVHGDRAPLRALARRVAVDDRPYRPHLTVARTRGPVDLRPVVGTLEPYDGPGWRADAVHLVRSHLGPQPRYDDIATWPLAPPGSSGPEAH